MDSIISLAAVVLLLAINAFFVAAEFALVKSRSFRIEALADGGSRSARLTLRIQHQLEAYLAACQLGITMASLGLGWVGEPAVAALLEPLFTALGLSDQLLHTMAFLTGFLIFSSLHIVIGEQLPKTFAIRKPEPVSLWCAYPLRTAYLLVYPLNWLLNAATQSLLRLFKVEEATHAEVLSSAELQGLVATSHEHGELRAEKARMLSNLFEFDRHLVTRVMRPRNQVHTLDLRAEPEETLRVIRETGHARFPVVDGDRDEAIVGLVLAQDLYAALLDGNAEPWRDLRQFCREPLVVPESQGVSRLFQMMRLQRAHMALVIDEYGEFVGIVTLEDLIEEIVGEILDETDDEVLGSVVTEIGPGRWQADGLLSLGDAERALGLHVAAEVAANSLSGLFMERLGRMPVVGDRITESGFLLTVSSLDERRVGAVVIERQQQQRDPSGGPPDADVS